MIRSRFRSILLVSALALAPAQAWAQASDAQRITQLEELLASQQKALDLLKAQIEALKPAPVTPPPMIGAEIERTPIVDTEPICTMRNRTDLNLGLRGRSAGDKSKLLPNLNDCERDEVKPGSDRTSVDQTTTSPPTLSRGEERVGQSEAPTATTQLLRPGVASGFSSSLQFGKDGAASLAYSHPFVWRKPGYNESGKFDGLIPQQGALSIALNIPLDKDLGFALSEDKNRTDVADLNLLSGTSLRLAFDFMQFRKRDEPTARRNVTNILYEAYASCMGAKTKLDKSVFASLYDSAPRPYSPELLPKNCSGETLIEFITATKEDESATGGLALIRPDLATRYQQAFWTAPKTEAPHWGWGVSADISAPDFIYSQVPYAPHHTNGVSGSGTKDDPYKINFDYTRARANSFNDGKMAYALGGYLMYYQPIDAMMFPGIAVFGSVRHSRDWDFRPGTKDVTLCPVTPTTPLEPGQLSVVSACEKINIDAPYPSSATNLALELRMRVDSIPLIGSLGLAPKFTYRLNDGRYQIEAPLSFTFDASRRLWSGVKLQHQAGGVDLLGNANKASTVVTIFFSVFSFRPF